MCRRGRVVAVGRSGCRRAQKARQPVDTDGRVHRTSRGPSAQPPTAAFLISSVTASGWEM